MLSSCSTFSPCAADVEAHSPASAIDRDRSFIIDPFVICLWFEPSGLVRDPRLDVLSSRTPHLSSFLRGTPLQIVSRPLHWAVRSLTLGLVLALPSAQARAQTAPAVDSVSTLAGVYTQEQAKRGKEVYLTLCRSCHVPSTGEAFAQRWAGKTLLDLFTYIYATMPDNNPRSVDEVSNADVIAYLMQSTGMPVGTHDVPVAADSLKAIRIEVKKSGPTTGFRF